MKLYIKPVHFDLVHSSGLFSNSTAAHNVRHVQKISAE